MDGQQKAIDVLAVRAAAAERKWMADLMTFFNCCAAREEEFERIQIQALGHVRFSRVVVVPQAGQKLEKVSMSAVSVPR